MRAKRPHSAHPTVTCKRKNDRANKKPNDRKKKCTFAPLNV